MAYLIFSKFSLGETFWCTHVNIYNKLQNANSHIFYIYLSYLLHIHLYILPIFQLYADFLCFKSILLCIFYWNLQNCFIIIFSVLYLWICGFGMKSADLIKMPFILLSFCAACVRLCVCVCVCCIGALKVNVQISCRTTNNCWMLSNGKY